MFMIWTAIHLANVVITSTESYNHFCLPLSNAVNRLQSPQSLIYYVALIASKRRCLYIPFLDTPSRASSRTQYAKHVGDRLSNSNSEPDQALVLSLAQNLAPNLALNQVQNLLLGILILQAWCAPSCIMSRALYWLS